MHSLMASIAFKGVWGEKFKGDSHGEAKYALLKDLDLKIYEIKSAIDSGMLAKDQFDNYIDALNALYAARDAVESMWMIFNG